MPNLTFLALINDVDSFPSPTRNPELHSERLAGLHSFVSGTHTLGYVTAPVAAALRGLPESLAQYWTVTATTIDIAGAVAHQRSVIMAGTLAHWRAQGTFGVVAGRHAWRDELYAVYAPAGELFLTMERSGAALFGVVTYGVHMTAYIPPNPAAGSPQLRIWTPRRTPAKTYGGMLDNTVAGGIAAGMGVRETLVKESAEEASLPASLVVGGARAAGAVSYFYERDWRAGGETGLLQPEVEYVYDLEVDESVVPRPGDDEVADFCLMTVDQVKQELAQGNFKPNCALVLIDFFVRHGIITPDSEPDYIEIVARLHRTLEFPLARHAC